MKPHGSGTPHLEREERLKYVADDLKIRIDAYRFYFNLALQINAFFYVTTGVVLGFYLDPKNQQPGGHLVYFLLLPILIGSVLGAIFIFGAKLQRDSSVAIERLRNELNNGTGLDIAWIPDINLLRLLLTIFGIIFFFVTAALILVPHLTVSAGDLQLFSALGGAILLIGVLLGLILLPCLSRLLDKGLKAAAKNPAPPAGKRVRRSRR